jgi:lysophospholipid acyltransferase (LPLAT)-like uncharacterized protein
MQYYMYGVRMEDRRSFVLVVVGDERHHVLDFLAKRLGAETFAADMQGSPFAAGRAVLKVIQAMKKGKQSFIAPDGPDGPPFVAKPGVATIARKAMAAVLPVGMWTRHAYQLHRWDRYIVPLPFAHIHMVVGPAIMPSTAKNDDALIAQISTALDSVRCNAQIAAGIEPWR